MLPTEVGTDPGKRSFNAAVDYYVTGQGFPLRDKSEPAHKRCDGWGCPSVPRAQWLRRLALIIGLAAGAAFDTIKYGDN